MGDNIKVMQSPLSTNVLTRAQFVEEIDAYFAEKKRRYLDRFDQGRKIYGGDFLNLDSEDWIEARKQEMDDTDIYGIIEIARLRRMR